MLTDGYVKVAQGEYCEVWFSEKAKKTFGKASAKDRARTSKILDHLSEAGPDNLNEQQFKSEARFPNAAGKNVMVYATKSYQLRVYGCWVVGPPRRFVCPDAAIKKNNKADRGQLKRVAKSVGE